MSCDREGLFLVWVVFFFRFFYLSIIARRGFRDVLVHSFINSFCLYAFS